MKKAIIGKKIGMTQIFTETGAVIPVTVIEAGPCVVAQKKTVDKDGYSAVQLGFCDIAEKKLTNPLDDITDSITAAIQNTIISERTTQLVDDYDSKFEINQQLLDSFNVVDMPVFSD